MKYRYRIWCSDCCNEDPRGCFGGSMELSEESYEAYEHANEAGDIATAFCGLWEYCVTDENGNEVKEAQ